MKPLGKRLAVVCLMLVAGGLVYGLHRYRLAMAPPARRLMASEVYSEMPEDPSHRYLEHPLVDGDAKVGTYRGFYILCPGFHARGQVVFFLTDGQMELVDTQPDFGFFDEHLGGLSYVVIGHRGHTPTLFPEVYRSDGSLELEVALRLYGSAQQVHDVERVRQDMERRGELPQDGKICLFGASGAGFLVQQYLSAHGEHVRRAVIEVSGAPDLAADVGGLSPTLVEFNGGAAAELQRLLDSSGVDRQGVAYALYQIGRAGAGPRAAQLALLRSLARWGRLAMLPYYLRPSTSWPLCQMLMRFPAADAARVRMYELLGAELARYANTMQRSPHLMYEWAAQVLEDFVRAGTTGKIAVPTFPVDRTAFGGEVLVLSGADDVVFSRHMGKAVAKAYRHSRFLVLRGGHRRAAEDLSFARGLRQHFFEDGLISANLGRLMRDERVVSTED